MSGIFPVAHPGTVPVFLSNDDDDGELSAIAARVEKVVRLINEEEDLSQKQVDRSSLVPQVGESPKGHLGKHPRDKHGDTRGSVAQEVLFPPEPPQAGPRRHKHPFSEKNKFPQLAGITEKKSMAEKKRHQISFRRDPLSVRRAPRHVKAHRVHHVMPSHTGYCLKRARFPFLDFFST